MHALHKDMSFSALETIVCVCSCVVWECECEGGDWEDKQQAKAYLVLFGCPRNLSVQPGRCQYRSSCFIFTPPPKSQILSLQGFTAGLCAQNNVWIFPTKHQPAPLRHHAANAVVSTAAAAGSNYLNIVSGLITVT